MFKKKEKKKETVSAYWLTEPNGECYPLPDFGGRVVNHRCEI